MSTEPENEVEFIMLVDDDGHEVTIIMKSDKPLSNNQVILELEYYINQLSGAEVALSQGGTLLH